MATKKLYRSRNKVIAGVCGGLAKYFNLDPVLVRILYVVLSLASLGIGVVAYILLWIFVPEER
ncbi:MAG: PspC domain-containing protein [Nanoarchaeota archaeon]